MLKETRNSMKVLQAGMLKYLNKGEFYAAAKEFDRWIYAGGKVSEGLKNRRTAEKTLFLT